MVKKLMIDVEATLNSKILVTRYHPKAQGIGGAIAGMITPKQEPEKRSFENFEEFSKWIKQEIGAL